MPACRCSRQNKPRWIEAVIASVISKPPQRTTTIFDRRWRRRLSCRSILDIDRRPTELEVRQQVQNVPFLLPVNPTAAMKENQCLIGATSIFWKIQIEFKL